jgi:long-chain fatty acid transport protein
VRKSIVLSLLLAPSLASASGYSLPNTNPRDLGMSASTVAAQRDSGAAFALPAALARLRGPYVSIGGGAVNVFNSWTDPTPGATLPRYTGAGFSGQEPPEPGSEDMNLTFTPFPNISFAYGGELAGLGNRGWGVGVSLQPFGGAQVDWNADWAGRYRITEVDHRSFSGILSAGIEVHPQIRLGGGVMYYYTMRDLKQKAWIQFVAPATPQLVPDATAELDISGGAFSYDLSAEIDPIKGFPLTIAVDYKHQAVQDLDGDVTWTDLPPALATTTTPVLYSATGASQTLTIPNLLNVGVAYRAMKPLLVTFGYTFDRWEVYQSDFFTGNNGATLEVPRDYRNGHTLRAGAEYDISRAFQVRAGLQRDFSGLRTATYSPTLPDASSWAVSGGGTFRFGRGFSVDLAVFYANMDEVTATDVGREPGIYGALPAGLVAVPQGTFRGTYNPQALVYTLAVAWHPGAPAPAQ